MQKAPKSLHPLRHLLKEVAMEPCHLLIALRLEEAAAVDQEAEQRRGI